MMLRRGIAGHFVDDPNRLVERGGTVGILPKFERIDAHPVELRMTGGLLDDPCMRAGSLLRDNPINDLRPLQLTASEDEIVISGVVNSYYLKQMAQETVRPALAGRRLRNKIVVVAGSIRRRS
jgi:hypothetical protein